MKYLQLQKDKQSSQLCVCVCARKSSKNPHDSDFVVNFYYLPLSLPFPRKNWLASNNRDVFSHSKEKYSWIGDSTEKAGQILDAAFGVNMS